jgi:hypothetical protein
MTHIKIIFSSLPGIGKHFIGNILCTSDNSVTQLIHILHFSTINNVFYKLPEEKILRSQICRTERAGNESPFSFPTMRKLPVQKDMNSFPLR